MVSPPACMAVIPPSAKNRSVEVYAATETGVSIIDEDLADEVVKLHQSI